jgi:amino acid transporter
MSTAFSADRSDGTGVFSRNATGLVRSEFSAAMPRSGGDYVFVSRALHPFVGWLLSWSQGLWLIFFWIGFNAWFALTFAVPVALSTIGTVTGQDLWLRLSNDLLAKFPLFGITTQWWVLVLGTVINVAFALLLVLGGNGYWRWQKVFFLFAGGSILVAVVLLSARGGGFSGAWDAFANKAGGLRSIRSSRPPRPPAMPGRRAASTSARHS